MPDRLRTMLRLHEGEKLKPYRDTRGILTIGVGHNLDANGISPAISAAILEEDIAIAVAALTKNLPAFASLDEVRRDVLIDMGFNLGWPRLSEFVRFLAAVTAKDYPRAATEMLASDWATQVGARATMLAAMMRTGQWAA